MFVLPANFGEDSLAARFISDTTHIQKDPELTINNRYSKMWSVFIVRLKLADIYMCSLLIICKLIPTLSR